MGKNRQREPAEYKSFPFKLASLDTEGRTLEGYASVFGNVDAVGDIVHPGAFRKTLRERGDQVRFLWQHDPREPIGRLMEMREDEHGLFVKAIISKTRRGLDTLHLLHDGVISQMSIGYDPIPGGEEPWIQTARGAVPISQLTAILELNRKELEKDDRDWYEASLDRLREELHTINESAKKRDGLLTKLFGRSK